LSTLDATLDREPSKAYNVYAEVYNILDMSSGTLDTAPSTQRGCKSIQARLYSSNMSGVTPEVPDT
jgi:hypothetical protein